MIGIVGKPLRKIHELSLVSPMVCRTQALPVEGIVKVNAIVIFKGSLRLIVEIEEDVKIHGMIHVAFRDVGSMVNDSEGEYLDTILVNDWFHNVYIRQT
jgi:hypothetical protein